MNITISDVDQLETELQRIKDDQWNHAKWIKSIGDRLSTLENIIACDGIDARLHPQQPATPKPGEIRIKPDDMVTKLCDVLKYKIAKYNSDDRLSEIIDEVKSEYISPIQPVRREWIKDRQKVWRAYYNPSTRKWIVDKTTMACVDPGELWLPIIEGEPAPEAPEVK